MTVQLKPTTSRSGRRRLDFASTVRLRRAVYFFDAEVDGRPHIGTAALDLQREEEVDLPTLRYAQALLESPDPLTPRLLDFALTLPDHPRARKPLSGPWL